MPPSFTSPEAWALVSRLGEAQVLLPALVAVLLRQWLRLGAARIAGIWLGSTAAVASLTLASKLAFIGWGVGWAALDFTGFSGHSMFSAAILPVLAATVLSSATWRQKAIGIAAAYALAALVAVSRVVLHAHSVSEAIAGSALGASASAFALAWAAAPRNPTSPRLLVAGLALWLVAAPAGTPPSRTHDLVTRLALALSGHERPYTRAQMHLRDRLERPAQVPLSTSGGSLSEPGRGAAG